MNASKIILSDEVIQGLHKTVDLLKEALVQCGILVIAARVEAKVLVNIQINPKGNDDTQALDAIAVHENLLRVLQDEITNPKINILNRHITQRERVIQDAIADPKNIKALEDFLRNDTESVCNTIMDHYKGLNRDIKQFLLMLKDSQINFTFHINEMETIKGRLSNKPERILH
jgi:hypothetical protein